MTGNLYGTTNHWVTNYYIPPAASVDTVTYSGEDRVKTIEDVETPHFTSLLKCGKILPINPVVIKTTVRRITPWSGAMYAHRVSDHALKGQTSGQAGGDPYPTRLVTVPVVDSSFIDLVVTSARANAANFEWDVLTFLAEFHKTAELMRDAVGRFTNLSVALAVEARKARRNPYQRFRELWLGARYNVRPIMYDMLNAAQAMSSKLGDSDIIRGRGKHVTGDTLSLSLDHVFHSGTSGVQTQTQTDYLKWERTYRSVVFMSLDDAMRHRFGTDPLVTAWELTPYSFVADWFTDIGRWVSSLRPSLLGSWLGQSVSIKTAYTYDQHLDSVWSGNPDPTTVWSGSASGYIYHEAVEEYTRFSYSGTPLPTFRPRLTLPKVVDLVALIFRGRGRVMKLLDRR